MPRYPSGLEVVAELYLAGEHTSVRHMWFDAVKGDDVLLLHHVERAKVKGTPGSSAISLKVASTSSSQCITTSMQPKHSTPIFLLSPMIKYVSSGPGKV